MNAPLPPLTQRIASNRVIPSTAWHKVRQDRLSALPWAVWMGANTSQRLAAEWGITEWLACQTLRRARRLGLLRLHHTTGRRITYRVARLEVGMYAGVR